jgi:FkbM family methyltransferase
MIVGFEDYKHNYNFTDVTGIIHVGAHHGQEYEEYINTFGNIKTHWFEPLKSAFIVLIERIAKYQNVHLYPFALGEEKCNLYLNVDNQNEGQSSSILSPKEHINIFPHIKFESKQIVYVKPLDFFDIKDSNMLVLDTQGYELKCLKGSIQTLKHIKYIFAEFNTIELYEGCPTFDEINMFLNEHGFYLKEKYYTEGYWGDAFWSK